MKILLVRHGESEANVDRSVHQTIPDHAISLSPRGREQAANAGTFVTRFLVARDNQLAMSQVRFPSEPGASQTMGMYVHVASGKLRCRLWKSPYARARQTADIILDRMRTLTGAEPMAGVREHVALAEQQFGLFDGLEDAELASKYPAEHAHYKKCEDFEGRFWARMPLGESRFDVALRVHQAFGTFQRDAEKHRIDTIVIVAHGTTIRAITMQWLHLPVEWFEKEPNPKNCSVRLIDDNGDQGYIYAGGDP